jgi:hypothetical protein
MSAALNGIVVYGQALYIKNSSNALSGYLYANYAASPINSGSNYRLALVSSGDDVFIGAGRNIILSSSYFVLPFSDNVSYLGSSTTSSGGSTPFDYTWKYIGAQIMDAKDLYKINNLTCIDQSGNDVYFTGNNAAYIQGSIGTNDIKCTSSRVDLYHDTYLSGTLFCTSTGISLNSRTYYGYTGAYDSSKYYLRSS